MARFDDARSPPVDESFSYVSMVSLAVLGARAAAGLPTTARGALISALRRGHCRRLRALEQSYCRSGPAGQLQTLSV